MPTKSFSNLLKLLIFFGKKAKYKWRRLFDKNIITILNIPSQKKRIMIISIMTIFCIAISYYFQSVDFGRVYTHLYYIPVILSCIWWRGIIIAVFLGITVIISHLMTRLETSILYDVLRVSLFIIIAVFVSKLSQKESIHLNLLKDRTKELEEAKAGLEKKVKERTKELELTKSRLEKKVKERTKELKSKLNKLEKFNKLTVNRELKMYELKKQNEDLKTKS